MKFKGAVVALASGFVVLATPVVAGQGNSQANERAQDEHQLAQQLRACARINSAIERLTCFDQLVTELPAAARGPAEQGQRGAGQGRGANQQIPPGAARGEERSERAQQEAEERAAAAERRAEEAERRLAQQRAEQAQRQAAQQQAEEEARKNRPPTEKTYYTIAEVWQNPRGLQRVRLDNGQVWEQISSDGNFAVREGEQYYIEPARFGGFFLGTDGSNRRMRVRPSN
ncbi:hypothetical protein [Aliidiomarina sp.]|uniref:hypothetical protein n=1 Tax=Aliidiomarina sp. TaxID=1872439 RepID=UPI003A4E05DF